MSFFSDGDSPRIRGDGPRMEVINGYDLLFSPYSRGWSPLIPRLANKPRILPVFAGMVPSRHEMVPPCRNSPRIRGDGPPAVQVRGYPGEFSPYSRGWSRGR